MARSKSKRANADEAREVRWAHSVRRLWEEIRSELESDVTENTSAAPGLKPTDRLFAQLVNLAEAPAAGIERLRRGVCYELSLQRMVHPKSRVAVGSKKRALAQLRGSARLSRELFAIVSNLDQQASAALIYVDWRRDNFGRPPGADENYPPRPPPKFSDWSKLPWFKTIAEFAELSSEALAVVQAGSPPKPRGRPCRGAFSIILSGSLVEFTLNGLLDVRAAGGRLTLDKNAGTGTLVEALGLLRPHMPQRFIPNKLPLSTLARVKALDEKIATARPPIENIQS
jgi:hypothetical protein